MWVHLCVTGRHFIGILCLLLTCPFSQHFRRFLRLLMLRYILWCRSYLLSVGNDMSGLFGRLYFCVFALFIVRILWRLVGCYCWPVLTHYMQLSLVLLYMLHSGLSNLIHHCNGIMCCGSLASFVLFWSPSVVPVVPIPWITATKFWLPVVLIGYTTIISMAFELFKSDGVSVPCTLFVLCIAVLSLKLSPSNVADFERVAGLKPPFYLHWVYLSPSLHLNYCLESFCFCFECLVTFGGVEETAYVSLCYAFWTQRSVTASRGSMVPIRASSELEWLGSNK